MANYLDFFGGMKGSLKSIDELRLVVNNYMRYEVDGDKFNDEQEFENEVRKLLKAHGFKIQDDKHNVENAINEAIAQGKNIVAVGTTSVRTLETTMQKYGKIIPVKDHSELFIYPGFEFKIVNKIITNFHLPKSTLLMLVSAFAGREFIFDAYKHAIENQYRFYSYGDCMFIK